MDPNDGDVADPPDSVTGDPIFVPVPCGQPGELGFVQSWNCTEPVTVPAEPVSVAVSVSEPPAVMVVLLTCVAMVGGPATAAAARARSCEPVLAPSRESRAMWYGEPETALAELPTPQSSAEAMWPPQVSTTFHPPLGAVPETLNETLIVVLH